MTCHLIGPKPLSEAKLARFNQALSNKFQLKLNQNSTILFYVKDFESVVCKMAVILFRPQCVNDL